MVGKERAFVLRALQRLRLLSLGGVVCALAGLFFLVFGWPQMAVYVLVAAVAIKAAAVLLLFLL